MNAQTNQRINEMPNRWAPWLMILGLIVFALLMFHEVLAPGMCLFSTDNNIGQTATGKQTMPGGFLGAWSDGTYLGMPMGIQPIVWLSILTWLMPLTLFNNWIHAIDLIMASLFIVLFLRRQQIGWTAIAFGLLAAFWLGSNLTLTYAGHTGKYGVVMMACASLFCLSRALSRHVSIPWSLLTGGAIGFMFLEQLDVALFFGFVLGAYALFLAVRQWQTNGTWVKTVVALVLMGGALLLLAASTMLGSYASNVKGAVIMQTQSPREKWDYVTQWSVPTDETIDLIAPNYFGIRSGEPEGPYWGRTGQSAGWDQTHQGFMNFKLESIYIGAIPVMLALFAVAAALFNGVRCSVFGVRDNLPRTLNPEPSWSNRRAEILFWGAAALITLLLAYGKYFPLYALFYQLPMVNAIRNPNKFIQIFQLCLGILAAYGMDAALKCRKSED